MRKLGLIKFRKNLKLNTCPIGLAKYQQVVKRNSTTSLRRDFEYTK